MTTSAPAFSVLVVCTGNICRSPAAEFRLRQLLGADVAVTSAGLHALVGQPVDPAMAALLGPGVEGFRARQVMRADVLAADLVLVMTAEQRRALSVQAPVAVRRIFTLLEFAELAELWREAGAAEAGPPADAALPGQLAELVAAAPRLRSRRRGADDVDDPYRRGAEAHARALAAIDAAVTGIGRALRTGVAAG